MAATATLFAATAHRTASVVTTARVPLAGHKVVSVGVGTTLTGIKVKCISTLHRCYGLMFDI